MHSSQSGEMNTRSTVTNYKSGDIFHAEFTATKTIGNWTFGPVGYYAGQVTDDLPFARVEIGVGADERERAGRDEGGRVQTETRVRRSAAAAARSNEDQAECQRSGGGAHPLDGSHSWVG